MANVLVARIYGTDWKNYKLNGFSSSVLSSINQANGNTSSIEWDDTYLWETNYTDDTIFYHTGWTDGTSGAGATPSINPTDITCDSTDLYSCDNGTDLIYKHVGKTNSVASSIAAPNNNPWGLSHDGSDLYSADYNNHTIYQHDGFTTTILDSFVAPANNPMAVGWDGTNIIIGTVADSKLYKMVGFSSSVSTSFAVSAIWTGTVGYASSVSLDDLTTRLSNLPSGTGVLLNSFRERDMGKYLGKKQVNEIVRFNLTLNSAPTGTPTVAISGIFQVTDLASNGAGTGISSATGGFTAAMVNDYIYISGGSGFTPGWYLISAYTDTNNITISTSAGASASGGIGQVNAKAILAATNMIQGASNLEWHYDYRVAAAADEGAYYVKYSAVVSGTTYYDYDAYDVFEGNGAGAYNATINVKDDVPANVANALVTIHNSNDDDSPEIARGTTDASGNVTLNLDGNVYVRVKKAGFTFTSTAKSITSSTTYNVTGTVTSYVAPTDPDLCRLYVYPITLDNQDITDLVVSISCKNNLTKVNGEFIKNATSSFTYNASTSPDSYYFDAVQGAVVQITCSYLGIDESVTVPAVATKDLYDLIEV